jgi:VanZ family protein
VAGGRSSDSGLPLRRLPEPGGLSGVLAESTSPYSGGTVPDLHRVPFPLADCEADITIGRMALPRLVSSWAPVVLWAGVIFAVSSIPSLSTELGVWDLVLRKLAHFTEYAVLGFLLARAAPALPAFTLGLLYAVSDEVHQSFVSGRKGAPEDVAVDAVGLLVGVLVLRRIAR